MTEPVLRDRPSLLFFRALYRAAPAYALAFWVCLVARAALPAALAVASGWLIGAITSGTRLALPLTVVGVLFITAQVLPQLHQALNSNLGSLTASHFFDRILNACVSPAGVKHLEDAELAKDLVVARDFELGITGPPLSIGIDFIAGGLTLLFSGIASALVLFGYSWWAAPLMAAAWGATHWLLREAGVWRDRETDAVRSAERHADYAYRLAVDAPAAKELRLFGLAEWVIERFVSRRTRLYELRWEATRMRERSLLLSLAIVLAANAVVLGMIIYDLAHGTLALGRAVTFLQAAVGSSAIAFGGLSWALDGAGAVAKVVARLDDKMQAVGALTNGAQPARGLPRRDIRFRGVSFAYAPDARPVLDHFDLTIPAGSSLAIVGVNGAGKTTLAKLLCRLYDPQAGAIEVDGIDLRDLDIAQWRSRVTAVFQDYIRYELSLRSNVAPLGAAEDAVRAALQQAGAEQLAELDTILARGYPGGTELSGGQWQRVALARALCAVQLGAGVVLLDEPTAQLDVRGEAEIFERILAATRECTTILVSHRFSTVRHADRICVLEAGRVVELGTHDELMALGGRYRTMFDLQAARFVELDEQGAEVVHDTL
jgi:ATP-binding cassette subfamily B protein